MPCRRTRSADHWRMWIAPSSAAVAMLILSAAPAPLIPLAHAYQDLCARYPVFAQLTRHLPPVSVAFLATAISVALVVGGVAGITQVIRARCLIGRLGRHARRLPEPLAIAGASLGVRGRVVFLDQPILAAFCFGLIRPRIAVSAGLLARLDDEEMLAVLAHERHHLQRRDPLRFLLLDIAAAAMFIFPLSSCLRRRVETRLELAADRAAVTLTSPAALAGALLAMLAGGELAVVGAARLSATETRIAHLTGQAIRPAIPARAAMASLLPIAAMIAVMAELAASSPLVRMTCALCVRLIGG